MKTAKIQQAIRRIDGWLAREPVFSTKSGAVAGVTNEEDVVYWYGEIAGYYLAYLSSLIVESSRAQKYASHAAMLVSQWLQLQWANEPPPTRLFKGLNMDWRNNYVFAFDLAMILKGLASARRIGIKVWHGKQIAELIKARLIDDQGSLRAVYPAPKADQPETWSMTIDGHQLKAATGLISWGTHFNDYTIRKLGEGTLRNLTRNGIHDWPYLPLHPRLYALEGLLLSGLVKSNLITTPVQIILSHLDTETERTDVIAQLLRLALFTNIEVELVDGLALHLTDVIDTDGSVIFRKDQTNKERNTWCALFARQALHAYNMARCGRPVHPGVYI